MVCWLSYYVIIHAYIPANPKGTEIGTLRAEGLETLTKYPKVTFEYIN